MSRQVRSALVVLLACGLGVTGAGSAIGAATGDLANVVSPAEVATLESPDDTLPILGQLALKGNRASGDAAVLTLHGVRRVEGGTVVYYSLGIPSGGDASDQMFESVAAIESLGSEAPRFDPRLSNRKSCDVAAIDQVGALLYTPLPGPICTATPSGDVGAAYVAAAAIAPVPLDVRVVDISIHGALFTDIPVDDGALEPVADVPPEHGANPRNGLARHRPHADRERGLKRGHPAADAAGRERGRDDDGDHARAGWRCLVRVNSHDINPAGRAVIETAVEQLTAKAVTGTLTVIGHTDSLGIPHENQLLSERRAGSVADALRPLLGGDITITTEGRGQTDPIASNESDEGRQLNRRVTLDFTPEEQR